MADWSDFYAVKETNNKQLHNIWIHWMMGLRWCVLICKACIIIDQHHNTLTTNIRCTNDTQVQCNQKGSNVTYEGGDIPNEGYCLVLAILACVVDRSCCVTRVVPKNLGHIHFRPTKICKILGRSYGPKICIMLRLLQNKHKLHL